MTCPVPASHLSALIPTPPALLLTATEPAVPFPHRLEEEESYGHALELKYTHLDSGLLHLLHAKVQKRTTTTLTMDQCGHQPPLTNGSAGPEEMQGCRRIAAGSKNPALLCRYHRPALRAPSPALLPKTTMLPSGAWYPRVYWVSKEPQRPSTPDLTSRGRGLSPDISPAASSEKQALISSRRKDALPRACL